VTVSKPLDRKDPGQLAYEQRRNARRALTSYVRDCHTEKWPSLSDEERAACREALRNLVERA
jgi:hypothetical protein